MSMNKELAREYHRNLPRRIRDYLWWERGIPDTMIERFLLGWNGLRARIDSSSGFASLSYAALAAVCSVGPRLAHAVSSSINWFQLASERDTKMLFDIHSHLQFKAYDEDRSEVIRRTEQAGVFVLNVGTSKKTSGDAVEISKKSDNFYASIGLHPIHTYKTEFLDELEAESNIETAFDYEFYKSLAKNPKVKSIGECGLDYSRIGGDAKIKKAQQEVFRGHIRLAKELPAPLMVHCRSEAGKNDSFDDLLAILKEENFRNKICLHFYSSDIPTAKRFLDNFDAYFSFGGAITFKKVQHYHRVIQFLPLEKILLETDAPYVAPEPYRGKRNEPLYVEYTARKLAEILGSSYEKTAESTLQNSRLFLGLS